MISYLQKRGLIQFPVFHHTPPKPLDDNENYGHLADDAVLQETAICLQAIATRPQARLFRYGGEEFAVLYSSCLSTPNAARQADKLRVRELK